MEIPTPVWATAAILEHHSGEKVLYI